MRRCASCSTRTGTGADTEEVLLLDTSAAVALVVEDHEAHAATLKIVRDPRVGLAGHAWFETYSVLTRLPGGRRRSPRDVAALLADGTTLTHGGHLRGTLRSLVPRGLP